MNATQKLVIRYAEANGLVIKSWITYNEKTNEFDETTEMPEAKDDFAPARVTVEANESGIEEINSFFTTRNINNSHAKTRVKKNGKFVNVKR